MTSPAWTGQLPPESTAVDRFPDCEDDELDLHDVYVRGAAGGTSGVLDKPEVVNVVLDGCDIAGYVANGGRADRLLVKQSRLRGVTWAAGLLRDIVLEGVIGDDVSLRFSTLRRVVFRDCTLPGIDLTEVTLDEVHFERCQLAGARLHGAKVQQLRIEGCDLTACSGAAALAGASVHPDDLASLAPSLAEALGLTVSPD